MRETNKSRDTYRPDETMAYRRIPPHRRQPVLSVQSVLTLAGATETAEWRVVGADCPWNPNPGKRLTFHNGNLVDVMD